MGDEFSDWEGMYYTFTETNYIDQTTNTDTTVSLSRTTISNARINSSVDQYNSDESSFFGFVSWGKWVHDSAEQAAKQNICVVNFIRITFPDEEDTEDGTVRRIQSGITMKGSVWDNTGAQSFFDVGL